MSEQPLVGHLQVVAKLLRQVAGRFASSFGFIISSYDLGVSTLPPYNAFTHVIRSSARRASCCRIGGPLPGYLNPNSGGKIRTTAHAQIA